GYGETGNSPASQPLCVNPARSSGEASSQERSTCLRATALWTNLDATSSMRCSSRLLSRTGFDEVLLICARMFDGPCALYVTFHFSPDANPTAIAPPTR